MLKLVLGASGSGKTTLLYARVRPVPRQGRQHPAGAGAVYFQHRSAHLPGTGDASFRHGGKLFLHQPGRAHPLRRGRRGGADPFGCRADRAGPPRAGRAAGQRPLLLPPPPLAAFCQMAAETIDELKSAGPFGAAAGMRWPGTAARRAANSASWPSSSRGMKRCWPTPAWTPPTGWSWRLTGWKRHWRRGNCRTFCGTGRCFVDEFDTFNAPKKRLMGAMLAALPTVTVALCDDGTPIAAGGRSESVLRRKAGGGAAAPAGPQKRGRSGSAGAAAERTCAIRMPRPGGCDPPAGNRPL